MIADCLQSVYSATNQNLNFGVIVVDNNSKDDTCAILAKQNLPNFYVSQNSENLGFAKACNQGIRRATGNVVLLLNPDIIVSGNAIEDTHHFLCSHDDIGVVGCKLLNPDGSLQYSCRQFPTVFGMLTGALGLAKMFPKSRLFGQFFLTHFDYASNRRVDVVNGAFFMMKRQLLLSLGMLDEDYFMYSEEMDYCYRISHTNWKVYYFAEAHAIHAMGHSTYQAHLDSAMFKQLHISRNLFYRKHFPTWKVVLLWWVGLMETGIRFFYWSFVVQIKSDPNIKIRQKRYKSSFLWYLRIPSGG